MEPLENKEWYLYHIYNEEAHKIRERKKQKLACMKGYRKSDVVSAVEWLKEEIKKQEKELGEKVDCSETIRYERLGELRMLIWFGVKIDGAFPDLKKEKEVKENEY